MKKFGILVIVFVFLVTGCGSKTEQIVINVKERAAAVQKMDGFESAEAVSAEDLKTIYDFDTDLLDEYEIRMPKIADKADMFMILKPKAGKMDEVRNMLNNFTEKYIEQFTLYAPEEADKINQKLISIKGDYLFYIISSDNEAVAKMILKTQ